MLFELFSVLLCLTPNWLCVKTYTESANDL